MKFLKYLFFLVLITCIGLAIYIAVQPNSFKVSRSLTIKAPAAVVYDNVIDFKNWESWSSWVESNPDMTINLSEKTKGIGGSYSWKDEDGKGKMTTISAIKNNFIEQEMQFADFPASEISWEFEQKNGSTLVTWSISGDNLPFGFKAFSVLSGGMEKQIGPHYERSLEKLDSVIQASMKVYNIKVNGISNQSGGYYLYQTTSSKINNLSTKVKNIMPKLIQYASNNNIFIAGKPFVIYHKWDKENNSTIFSICVPTAERIITTDNNILTGQLKPFKALKTTLKGDTKYLSEARKTAKNYLNRNNFEQIENGLKIERYITRSINKSNPADWITEIYIEVK